MWHIVCLFQQSQEPTHTTSLFLVLRLLVLVVSSGNTTRTTASIGRVLSELDVLLRVHMHHERRSAHHLAAHTDVSLADQHTSVVHRLRQTELEHLRLQSAIHQLRSAQLQNHIQLHALLGHQSQTSHTTDDGSSLEDSAGILLVQSQQLTSSLHSHHEPSRTHLADLRQHQLSSPDLTLAAQTVLSANAELLVQTLALIGATGSIERKTIYSNG